MGRRQYVALLRYYRRCRYCIEAVVTHTSLADSLPLSLSVPLSVSLSLLVSLSLSLSPPLFAAVSLCLFSEDQSRGCTFTLPRECMRKLPPRVSRRVGAWEEEGKRRRESRERPNRRETHRCQQPLQPPAAPAAVRLFAGGLVMGWDMVTSSGMATDCWNYSWP